LKILLLVLIILSGCAKVGYIVDQGRGYFGLLFDSQKNTELLKDESIPEEYKIKIRKIGTYKNYFYKYFDKKETGIYSKTTILKDRAVTYLVIASPYDKIEPIQFDFPIVGRFPYLGFFDPKKAKEQEQKLQDKSYVTYQRPVYAFSTLGHFEDRILSSFFYFKDFNLAELIFHELFHTIFFMKNDVDLNENLANYFGKEMALEFFQNTPEVINKNLNRIKKMRKISSVVQKLTVQLEQQYKEIIGAPRSSYTRVLETFLENKFMPKVRSTCQQSKVDEKDCYPLHMKWNNAKFAAYKSYEKDMNFFARLHKQLNINLKQYYNLIKKEYKEYYTDKNGLFVDYLKKQHPIKVK
jgi:predicted aminopeptidase